jgi:hypothetical protein
MDNSLTPQERDAFIEEALQAYPFAAMPRTITAEVIAQIKAVPAPRPFSFSWNDFILALIMSISIGAMWFSINHLPPLLLAQIRKESILFYQYLLVNMRWLIPTFAFGLAAFLSALTLLLLGRELRK